MKVYVATAVENKAMAVEVMKEVEARSHEITYNWTTHGRVYNEDELEPIAIEEVEGVKAADVLIVLLPGGWGTHCELGISLGLDRPILAFAYAENAWTQPITGKFCTFHKHPNIHRYETIETLLDQLDAGWI